MEEDRPMKESKGKEKAKNCSNCKYNKDDIYVCEQGHYRQATYGYRVIVPIEDCHAWKKS